jgi:tryptophan halogenase
MFKKVLVLGGGSAGLIAAMTFRRHFPGVQVVVVRSPEIGVIGVGESTTPNVPDYFLRHLGIPARRFYELVQPTWKLGVHFLWGPRQSFDYSFELSYDQRDARLQRPFGYYCRNEMGEFSLGNSLMRANKCFARSRNGGGPDITKGHAFHLENHNLVSGLEVFAREMGVEFIDGKMQHVERGPQGVAAIVLEDGQRHAADFFIDASGFRSELLGGVYQEPYISFSNSLFNDRAILGSWQRTDEPILPYTTAETMDAGWAWQIEHEHVINRGYVFCSSFISEEAAREEFARKNPKAKIADRVVKFRTGRYARGWVDNVVAIGNACGFVEPLEATSLMMICWQCEFIRELTKHVGITPTVREMYNTHFALSWDEIRDFLALHFWANNRLDTPYWRHCQQNTDVSGIADLLRFYKENGPTGFLRYHIRNPAAQFGVEGYLVMLVGNRVPFDAVYEPTAAEWEIVQQRRMAHHQEAVTGLDVREGLAFIRHPHWQWNTEQTV